MPDIVVTRLRLRDPALLDELFTDAVAAIERAMKSDGNLAADAPADANNAWWIVSAWQVLGSREPARPRAAIRGRAPSWVGFRLPAHLSRGARSGVPAIRRVRLR